MVTLLKLSLLKYLALPGKCLQNPLQNTTRKQAHYCTSHFRLRDTTHFLHLPYSLDLFPGNLGLFLQNKDILSPRIIKRIHWKFRMHLGSRKVDVTVTSWKPVSDFPKGQPDFGAHIWSYPSFLNKSNMASSYPHTAANMRALSLHLDPQVGSQCLRCAFD